MSCTLIYVFPGSSKNISKCEAIISVFISDTDCATHDEDKNAINLTYIVSFAKALADYFLSTYDTIIFWFFLEGQSLPSKFKPVRSFIHLFCYLFHTKLLLDAGADMNTMDDNNR